MPPPLCALAASAISVACSAFLAAAFKRVFRSECIDGQDVGPSGSALRPTIVSLLVAAALASVLTAACLVNTLSKRTWNLLSAICSKWQSCYFVVVSVQRVVLRAIVIPYANGSMNKRAGACDFRADYENQSHAATFLWDCAVMMTGVFAICTDVISDVTPSFRRSAQFLLALCVSVDAVGSYVWGNDTASAVSLDVSGFLFQLGNLITSCITSQVVLALHFAFVGWRSRHGRCWYYASLRFELEPRGQALPPELSLPHAAQGLKEKLVMSSQPVIAPTSESATDGDAGRSISQVLSLVRRRFLQFQQQRMLKCRVFMIPCVSVIDNEGGGNTEFALKRPAFDLRCLRSLQRIADAHPKVYLALSFFLLGLPSVACALLVKPQIRGIPALFLNSAVLVAFLGFLSGRRYNLDRVAVKEVALSFRFAVFIVLLSQWITLFARRAILLQTEGQVSAYGETPWTVAAITVVAIFFSIILLLDCSPNLPITAQIILMVSFRSQCLQLNHVVYTRFFRLVFGSYSDIGALLNFVVFTPEKTPIVSGILARIEYAIPRSFCQSSAACSCS